MFNYIYLVRLQGNKINSAETEVCVKTFEGDPRPTETQYYSTPTSHPQYKLLPFTGPPKTRFHGIVMTYKIISNSNNSLSETFTSYCEI
jgi:hypothetical protein